MKPYSHKLKAKEGATPKTNTDPPPLSSLVKREHALYAAQTPFFKNFFGETVKFRKIIPQFADLQSARRSHA